MKKSFITLLFGCLFLLLLSACGEQRELVDMESVSIDGKRAVIWEDRTYIPFCVVSKNNRGELIGYVDSDINDRISEYRNYSPDEWVVSWLPTDGGAMLMKEQNVVNIPDGLEAEY